jgi:hypothetical protein
MTANTTNSARNTPPSPPDHDGPEFLERLDASLDLLEEEAAIDARAAVAAAPGSPVAQFVGFVRSKARRVIVFIVGSSVFLAGIPFLVLPGPAILFFIAGLGILATEFAWASSALKLAKDKAAQAASPKNRGRTILFAGIAGTISATIAAWRFGWLK